MRAAPGVPITGLGSPQCGLTLVTVVVVVLVVVVPGVLADDVKLKVKKLVGVVTTKVLKVGVVAPPPN